MTGVAAGRRESLAPTWCIDEDTRHAVLARRNALLGLWAGRLMGLAGPELERYAGQVHEADFLVQGDSDVVLKVTADLHLAGLPVPPTAVRKRLQECHKQAWVQASATD
jgi:hypothetical protein